MYQLRTVTLKNDKKEKNILVIDFEDPQMQIIGEFLMADARLVGGKVLSEIDTVLAGSLSELVSNGNRCSLTIRKNTTTVSDLFSEMESVEAYPAYDIETAKLRELIVMWFKELNKFEQDN